MGTSDPRHDNYIRERTAMGPEEVWQEFLLTPYYKVLWDSKKKLPPFRLVTYFISSA